MKWRPVGVFFLLITLFLTGLIVSRYPTYHPKTNTLWDNHQVSVLSGTITWKSIPLSQSGKVGYSVQGTLFIPETQVPQFFDFWVVNLTGVSLLNEKNQTGSTPAGYPPKAYAYLSVTPDTTEPQSFELHDLDYEGEYYFGFVNNQTWNQEASMTLTETWQIPTPMMEPTPINLLIITLTTIPGLYLTIKNPRWPSKKPSKKRPVKKIRRY